MENNVGTARARGLRCILGLLENASTWARYFRALCTAAFSTKRERVLKMHADSDTAGVRLTFLLRHSGRPYVTLRRIFLHTKTPVQPMPYRGYF